MLGMLPEGVRPEPLPGELGRLKLKLPEPPSPLAAHDESMPKIHKTLYFHVVFQASENNLPKSMM
jgi:hypothetical protein